MYWKKRHVFFIFFNGFLWVYFVTQSIKILYQLLYITHQLILILQEWPRVLLQMKNINSTFVQRKRAYNFWDTWSKYRTCVPCNRARTGATEIALTHRRTTGAVRCLINCCKIYTFIYWQEFILSREHTVQIADGRKADCARERDVARTRACMRRGRGTRCCVCSNVSISITTPQRQSPHNIGRAGLLPPLRVREILIINNGRVPSQGLVRREGVRMVHIQAEGRREREKGERERERNGENGGRSEGERRRKSWEG